jgi:hypothetical protein
MKKTLLAIFIVSAGALAPLHVFAASSFDTYEVPTAGSYWQIDNIDFDPQQIFTNASNGQGNSGYNSGTQHQTGVEAASNDIEAIIIETDGGAFSDSCPSPTYTGDPTSDYSCQITEAATQGYTNYETIQATGQTPVEGCTDSSAPNYDPTANLDNGTCIYYGCTDPSATNYNPQANTDDGSCTYATVPQYVDKRVIPADFLLEMIGLWISTFLLMLGLSQII